ncbi:P-loop containing nucleoside triphosphate hydrolase protein [Cubamyces sp. BRFM 1775]|nr:P-loop containing nucleoside triphosphate hydrolase protein [Cubamyces sp. BRFM 1775]
MAPKTRTIHQNLIDDDYDPIFVQEEVVESKLSKETFDDLFEDLPSPRFVGLAPIYTDNGTLTRLAVAVKTKVIVIQFHAKGKGAAAYKGREILSSQVLCNPDVLLLAFGCDKLAIALYHDQNLRIHNAIDVQTACSKGRQPLAAIEFAAGDAITLMRENIQATFESSTWDSKRAPALALQAWVAQCLPYFPAMEDRFQAAKRIDTYSRTDAEMQTYAQLARGEHRLAHNAPSSITHDYTFQGANAKDKSARVKAERFQNRLRKSDTTTQRIAVRDPSTGLTFIANAEISSANGRDVKLQANASLVGREITGITTEGRDGPTRADYQREHTMLRALHGEIKLFDNPFLQLIMGSPDDVVWPDTFPTSETIPPVVTSRPLNASQQRAVEAMLSNTNDHRITLIQGPPGTGKTTVIAAFVSSAVAAGARGIWLVAQSNVAVKNIAEKLADVGFLNWRLLVSKDFHLGWHEHLYKDINKNIVTSKEFKRIKGLQDIPVMLCTLSMLAHPLINKFTTPNPIKIMVVDEASQITLGNYVAPFNHFSNTIHKVCMIGDDKQLPPYGADEDPNMQSIFEVEHLRSSAIFLDTQYRMPPLIGDAVSETIYSSQLRSNPNHPVPYSEPCCWFVHVDESEERRDGTSWHNPAERATVLKIAEKLQTEGKEYAFITPYDSQRTFLENEMKAAGLAWEDTCFNVDSFQGNERDYIIVSLRGMYIVTSWNFVWEKAASTLVGRMAAAWGEDVWVNPEHLTIDAE